jgi:hypothetical protein
VFLATARGSTRHELLLGDDFLRLAREEVPAAALEDVERWLTATA